MAPILWLLRSMAEAGVDRPATYYYGARTATDLFHLDELASGSSRLHLRPGPVRGRRRRLGRRDRAHHRRRRPPRGRPDRGRRLPLRSAADGRRRDRNARSQGRSRGAHLLRQVHHHRARLKRGAPWPRNVKERSFPKPVFTDAEAGAKEFPSSTSRSFNYFTPRKRRATVYEDVTIDVQPDPARHLTQGWVYAFADGTPATRGVDGAQVLQLARVPRSQRGVGADDLSQQREHRPPDPPEPRTREERDASPRLDPPG